MTQTEYPMSPYMDIYIYVYLFLFWGGVAPYHERRQERITSTPTCWPSELLQTASNSCLIKKALSKISKVVKTHTKLHYITIKIKLLESAWQNTRM